jgi:predicted flap endonuclease-1-like 5' DNA nuclease
MFKPNYKNVLKECGITYDDLVKNTKAEFDQMEAAMKELPSYYTALAEADPEDKAEAHGQIESFEHALSTLDKSLCNRIKRNKHYKERGAQLGGKNQNSKKTAPAAAAASTETPGSTETAPPAETKTETAPAATKETKTVTEKKDDTKPKDKDKKMSGWAIFGIIGGAIAAVGTAACVAYGVPFDLRHLRGIKGKK